MRLYYFTTAKYGLENIRLRRLKIARIDDLNDPFEFLQIATRNPRIRGQYQFFKRSLGAYMGLLCFSADWRSPVQWSHYAEKHRGICLGFDISASAGATPITYVEEMIDPKLNVMKEFGPEAEKHMRDLLTLKFKHWEYERERRIFLQLDKSDQDGENYFFSFAEDREVRLRRVIVGARSQVSREQVQEALGGLSAKVTAFKGRLAFHKFEVVRQKKSDLWRPTFPRRGLRQPTLEAFINRALGASDFDATTQQSSIKSPPDDSEKNTRNKASGDESLP
jgi:hypothetical protein